MKFLAVDIGTGTQDILLLNTELDVENAYKLILPSPTLIYSWKVRQATKEGKTLFIDGETIGGGPLAWAIEQHLRSGLAVFATPQAARTLNDDLDFVAHMGVTIIAEEQAPPPLPEDSLSLTLRDLDFPLIQSTFSSYGVNLDDLAAVAVSVFDHGNAPPNISDRQYRFDYLRLRLSSLNRLETFAYRAKDIPADMTRMQAVRHSFTRHDVPLVVMDSAPAAILGTLFDPVVAQAAEKIIVNIGNMHTLAFRIRHGRIDGLFEHHTGLLKSTDLEKFIRKLAQASLTHAEIFDHHGHGAILFSQQKLDLESPNNLLAVSGPRRNLIAPVALRAYYPAPFGDMMTAGCIGLLAATAYHLPEFSEAILKSLNMSKEKPKAPWDITK